MKQILVIVFPIFLPPFLGEFNPVAGCGSPQAGKVATARPLSLRTVVSGANTCARGWGTAACGRWEGWKGQ